MEYKLHTLTVNFICTKYTIIIYQSVKLAIKKSIIHFKTDVQSVLILVLILQPKIKQFPYTNTSDINVSVKSEYKI